MEQQQQQVVAKIKRPAQSLSDIIKDGFRIWCFKLEADTFLPVVNVSVRQFLQGKIRVSGICPKSGDEVSCFLKQEIWNEAVKQPKICKKLFANFDEATRQVAILLKPENAKAATAFYHYNKGDRKDESLLAGLSDVDELKKLFSKKEEKPQQKKRKAEKDAVVEKEANASSA